MKISTRFCCLFLFVLSMGVVAGCAGDVIPNPQTIPSVQSENNAPSSPTAPATAIPTFEPTEVPPVPSVTDTASSIEPSPSPFIKPADNDLPAAGICGNGAGEIVQIQLGTGTDGLPLGGRCVQIMPSQRIELVNLTSESLHVTFGMFDVELPPGSVVLLDRPVGEYLAPGVHSLPNGPEIWVKTTE